MVWPRICVLSLTQFKASLNFCCAMQFCWRTVASPEHRPECCFFGQALLLLLLPQNSQLRSQIEGVLDLELIRQEAEHGALDIHGLSTSILSTMAMLCAPFRDEEVQGLQSLTDPVELLRWVLLTPFWPMQTSKSINNKTRGLEETALQLYLSFFPPVCIYIYVCYPAAPRQ